MLVSQCFSTNYARLTSLSASASHKHIPSKSSFCFSVASLSLRMTLLVLIFRTLDSLLQNHTINLSRSPALQISISKFIPTLVNLLPVSRNINESTTYLTLKPTASSAGASPLSTPLSRGDIINGIPLPSVVSSPCTLHPLSTVATKDRWPRSTRFPRCL
ncbi:hypothetical protein ONS96_005594 [Cadophora gregata f. sp. sojae]|nr:hypothetical protein ONS96_005594 [Cadophora gregata f. sp. sojae]